MRVNTPVRDRLEQPDRDDQRIRLLVVDDDPTEAMLFERMLQRDYPDAYAIKAAQTIGEGLQLITEQPFDCVLLDHRLPDGFGVESLSQFREVAAETPIIILTGMQDPELEFTALAGGAQDYLSKTGLSSAIVRKATLHAIERARLQHEVVEAKAAQLETQQKFLSHVSHEIRTPVTAMYLSATNLADGLLGRVSAEQREAVDVISENAKQLRRLVDDLLDAARLTEGRVPIDVERVRMIDLIDGAVRRHEIRQGPSVPDIFIDAPPGVPAVLADRQRVVQILDNLLSNASKYAPGKTVTISHSWSPESPDFVTLSVSDTGAGIPEEHLETVFERMTQLETADHHVRRGLGLGLYISRDLAIRMGGYLWADASEEGSLFRLRLPTHPLDLLLADAGDDGPIETIVIDVDILAGNAVLSGTETADQLLAEAKTRLASEPTSMTVLPSATGHRLRCVAKGPDEHSALVDVEGLLAEIPALEDAGLRPTVNAQVVRGKKSRRRTKDERIDQVAEAILEA